MTLTRLNRMLDERLFQIFNFKPRDTELIGPYKLWIAAVHNGKFDKAVVACVKVWVEYSDMSFLLYRGVHVMILCPITQTVKLRRAIPIGGNWSTLASATSHYVTLIVVRLSVSVILHKHIAVGNFQSFWNDAKRQRKENKNGLLTMNPKASAQWSTTTVTIVSRATCKSEQSS